MSSNDTAMEMLTDDDIVAQNQSLRRKFINHLTQGGEQFPIDTKDQSILLTALADMDRSALQNKKIGSTEKQGAADRQAAMIIAAMSTQFGTERSPFELVPGQASRGIDHDIGRLPAAQTVPGETDIGVSAETVDEFMSRMDEKSGYVKK